MSMCKILQNKKFFKEPQPYHFYVLDHGVIPDNIQRPNYVLEENFDYYNKQVAIHKTQKDIDNHRKSAQITAKVLKHIEDMSVNDKVSFELIFIKFKILVFQHYRRYR